MDVVLTDCHTHFLKVYAILIIPSNEKLRFIRTLNINFKDNGISMVRDIAGAESREKSQKHDKRSLSKNDYFLF